MQNSRDNLVVKSKRLNLAIQDGLSLGEIRVLQLAFIEARANQAGNLAQAVVEIHGSQYSKIFDVSRATGYIALMRAGEKLASQNFTFLDEESIGISHKWCESIEYLEGTGILKIVLSEAVINELPIDTSKLLDRDYIAYRIEGAAALDSAYATRMFEILTQWRRLKSTPPLHVSVLRRQLGVLDGRYTRMSDLKRLVINHSIDSINALTTMNTTYGQVKDKKVIKAFQFFFHKTNRRGRPPSPKMLRLEHKKTKLK